MKISRRQFVQVLAVAGASALLTACGGSSNNSAAGSTAASGAAAAAGGSFNLKLGHNLAEDHAVHIQLTSFAEQVKEKTNGTVNIQIIPNGTLGSESDMISQIQAGALDMAKVSASTLGNFSEKYNAFSVPYVFDDQAHYYTYMDSDSAQAVFESTDDQGFRGLTWLDSGARSFYTKATAIRTPADLKGLKIRTMDSQMAIDMMNCLGGSATVMGYSDIYTGMQQGVIDGAENNVTALRDHGDVTKYYCFDEHTRIPDMVIISSNIWNQFSDDQKSAVTECAKAATEEYKTAWKNFEDEVLDKAVNQNGVELVRTWTSPHSSLLCSPSTRTSRPRTPPPMRSWKRSAQWSDRPRFHSDSCLPKAAGRALSAFARGRAGGTKLKEMIL